MLTGERGALEQAHRTDKNYTVNVPDADSTWVFSKHQSFHLQLTVLSLHITCVLFIIFFKLTNFFRNLIHLKENVK